MERGLPKMNLNGFGKIVDAEWQNLTIKYLNVISINLNAFALG
jgi:hypothetical protein